MAINLRIGPCILFSLFLAACTGSQSSPTGARVALNAASTAEEGAGALPDGGTPVVLFLCPHNASKSVMAAAHFERLARARGLEMRALSAGTHPGAGIDPRVMGLLRTNGIYLEERAPRRVTAKEMETAHRVVSLGCEPAELPSSQTPVIRWDDVPPPSHDLEQSHDNIVSRVEALVAELAREADLQ